MEKRSFSRLSALASWRSEYILRTGLLRSLSRGKPAQFQAVSRSGSSRHSTSQQAAAVITYGSGLLYPVSHLHATFGVGLNKKQPVFMHGAVEQGTATISDPSVGKVGNWGLGDYETFKHFADLFVGESEWGLGTGDIIGMPNVMDVSQQYGKVYGEACPGGRLFFTSATEQRGRFLVTASLSEHQLGIPNLAMIDSSVSSVWIAKSEAVLKASGGLFGLLAGFSNGLLAAYALGTNPMQDRRLDKGELTAKWILCPGVPIIAIHVDDKISSRRQAQRRIWAVVLNALGEVFYLTEVPLRPDFKGRLDTTETDRLAWQTGRGVEWSLIESTRRVARPDPFDTASVERSYTPGSPSDAMGSSVEQMVAETSEIEKLLNHKPKHFQESCEGWDMRRKLVVDFGGHDRDGGGESVIVITCGYDEGRQASARRFTRRKTKSLWDFDQDPSPPNPAALKSTSLFGGNTVVSAVEATPALSSRRTPISRTSSHEVESPGPFRVHWHVSDLDFGGLKTFHISAITTDDSDFAFVAANEDPLLGMSGGSNASSPMGSPLGHMPQPSALSEIPGGRARFIAIGTTTGVVLIWDMRASLSQAPETVNSVSPIRVIYTKSPEISCLAMTSLYLVHGGNDGLVQAWDPLASSLEPIRTLNSQFSARARRRLVQAQASAQGVGNNYYAAGAIALDPDPTVIRGMVSLGTHLRYWSYSSSAADAYKSSKRRQLRRRSDRGSNATTNEQRFSHTGRGVLRNYIANEKQELQQEESARKRELQRLSGRFGIGMMGEGASEEEMIAYATMLSQESLTSDEVMRRGNLEESVIPLGSTEAVQDVSTSTPHEPSSSSSPSAEAFVQKNMDLEPDVAEAIRLSLLDTEEMPPVIAEIPIRRAVAGSSSKSPITEAEANDQDFALQLSRAEAGSRFVNEDEFPALAFPPPSRSSSSEGGRRGGKRSGKGKNRAT